MLASVWKRKAEKRLIVWATQRLHGYALPFVLKINPDKIPAMRAAIEKMLVEMKAAPATMMVMYDVTMVPAPTKKLVYMNVADVVVV